MTTVRSWVKIETVLAVVAIAMVFYQLVGIFHLIVEPIPHQNIHLAFGFVLIFLAAIQKNKRFWPLTLLLLVASIVATGYIGIFYYNLEDRVGFPITPDVVIGVILILLCLEATRKVYGLVLPIIVAVAAAYSFVGYLFPEPFTTMYYPAGKIVSKLAILQGIYGQILSTSANYIFLFIIFGVVLEITGASRFFLEMGKLIGGRFRSGAAMSAVVTSGLFGTASGSVTANILVTGSFTIPLMKRAGYRPYQAAAIEATASSGGQIMPPVMGATAFIMSGITGISYLAICAAAAIPAVLYYCNAALYVYLQAGKLGVSRLREETDIRELLLAAPLFLVPLIFLVILMIMGYTPGYAVTWALFVLAALSFFRKKTRPSLKQWVQALTKGAVLGAEIAVACALLGIIVSTASLTGLGISLPTAMLSWSQGILPIALAITALIALVLGCAVTASAVYILVAVVAAPALIGMGLSILQAHLFAFYFAVISFVTPPVALGVLFAARIAVAPFFKSSVEAVKVASAGLIVPFLMILSPVLILQPQPLLSAVTSIVSTIVILITLQIAICNHYLTNINIIERALSLLAMVLAFTSMAMNSYPLFAAGIILFALLTIWQLRKRRLTVREQSTLATT